MSRQRQAARAERERRATELAAARRAEQERIAAERARREHRALLWRRVRIWQHGPAFRRRTREKAGALATLLLLVVLAVFVITRSLSAVLGTALVCVVAAPVLVMLFFDRSRK